MKKKTVIALVIVIAAAAFVCTNFIGRKPFANLKAEDIASASVRLVPPDQTVPVTDLDALAAALNDAMVYRKDGSYTEYNGQAVIYTIVLNDGTERTVNAYSPFLIIDGVGYRANAGSCEQLARIADGMIS